MKKTLQLVLLLLLGYSTQAQEAFTEETILWVCPTDATIKITYSMSNYDKIIEINGPFNLPENITVSGVLKISDGSLVAPKSLSATEQVKALYNQTTTQDKSDFKPTLDITIAERYYSKQFYYYGTNSKPFVTFEGRCVDTAKQKELDEALGKSSTTRETLKKDGKKDKRVRVKTKTAWAGSKG